MILDPGIDIGTSSPLKPILEKGSLILQKFGIPLESTCHKQSGLYNYVSFRDKFWRWIDSDLRKNEINSSYFERKWFSKNENDTRLEIFRGTITDIWTNLGRRIRPS